MGVVLDIDIKMAAQEGEQLLHMKRFIIHEALEKVEELNCAAEEAFFIEKSRIVNDACAKLSKDFERKQASLSSKNKITAAKENNRRRLELLKEQEAIVNNVVTGAGQQLQQFSQTNSGAYAQLLEKLITQGVEKMLGEDALRVHCLASEVAITQAATAKAKSSFEAKHGKSLDLQVDQAHPVPATDQATGEQCYGGIAISNMDHTIICQNTLNARLHIAADACLPQMKSKLFPTMQQLMAEVAK